MSLSVANSPNFRGSAVLNDENKSANPNMSGAYRDVSNLKQPEASANVKRGVLLTTALGVATGVALAFKRGKLIDKTAKKSLKTIDYDWKNVLMISSCSIGGGIVGGAIFDKKENMKAKLREGLIQMLGNIVVPIICVGGGTKLYDKFLKDRVIKKFKLAEKSKAIQGLPSVLVTALTLTTAIIAGFKTGNFINEDIYHIRDDRKFKFADMSGHLDDTCMAISLSDPNSFISKTASRIIPLALLVCGYSTGTMQEWPDDVKQMRKIDPATHGKHANKAKGHNA